MPTVTTRELADYLGITAARVSQLGREGMPRIGEGKWNLDACKAWRENKQRSRASGQDTLLAAKVRRESLACDKLEVELAQKAGILLPRADVEGLVDRIAVTLRSNLETWANDGRGQAERTKRLRIADATLQSVGSDVAAIFAGDAPTEKPQSPAVSVSRSMG